MTVHDDDIVISGSAPVCAVGTGRDAAWAGLLGGQCGVSKITRFDPDGFPVRLAAEVLDLDPAETIDRRLLVATDRWTHFGLVATELALADAALTLDDVDPYRVAVVTAAGSGGNEFGQREIEALWSRGPKAVTVYQSIAWFYAAATGQISIRHGSKGRCGVVAGGAAAGLDAVAQAAHAVRTDSDVAVVGGTEAAVSPYALTCQLAGGRLSTDDDPTRAYRPFGRDAGGYVVGEGGAMCVLERAAHCRDRGGRPLAVVAGHASTHDGRRGMSTDVEVAAEGLHEAIDRALATAGLSAGEVDAVFADGAGTSQHDHLEVTALRLALGRRLEDVPVTVPKAATGRMEAASSCLDVAVAASALTAQVLPPTINVTELAATSEIDLARRARPMSLRHVLVLARTHGGANAALVLSAA